ncbi:MAG: hypothetical protein ACOC1K_04585 [Nanoarchaeota archaeon]
MQIITNVEYGIKICPRCGKKVSQPNHEENYDYTCFFSEATDEDGGTIGYLVICHADLPTV